MSYRIEKKTGNSIYYYEVESYWDKNKKQPRQHRKYLGKKDMTTGAIITPIKSNKPKLSKDYGAVYLLEHIAKQMGLIRLLKKHFPDDYEKILALSYFMITDRQALYLYKDWVDNTSVSTDVYMKPKNISAFLHTLCDDEINRVKFLSSWTKLSGSEGAVVFDITSFSSYGVLNEDVEWGYNRDGENLPQVNLGVVYSDKKKLPLFYKTYQGSIKDVSTLKNISNEVSVMGISKIVFVLDRGFYSKDNIDEVIKNNFDFVIAGSSSSNVINDLITKHQSNIKNSDKAFLLGKQVMHHILDKALVGKNVLNANIYYSDKRKADEYDKFMRLMLEIGEKALVKTFNNFKETEEYINTLPGSSKNYFTANKVTLKITRNEKNIKTRLEKMGIMILLSNTEMDKSNLLDLYRRRDNIEKLFDILKNDLRGNRVRVHTKDSMDGLFFVKFISLILYSQLTNVMREKGLTKKYSVIELLKELKKLKKVEMLNGSSYSTEISKKQRNILEAFAVPIPLWKT